MSFQVAFESENAFAVKCQQVEFQVDGEAREKVRRVSLVCMRGTTSSKHQMSAEPEVVHGSVPAH